MALPGLVIAVAMIGDTLLYVVLPLYHQDFGISLAMVGVLLSLNRWIRLLANSGVAAIGERVGPHALMVMAAVGSVVSTTLYGLVENEAVQSPRACCGASPTLAQSFNPRLCRQRPCQCGKAGRRQPRRDRPGAGRVAGRRRVDRPAGRTALGVPDLRRPDADLAGRRPVAAPPAARDRRQEALPAAGPASSGDLGLHAGFHRRRRVPAHALLPDEGFDHLGRAGAGDGDPPGAALAGRDHHRPAGRLDRRPLRRAAHLDRQRRAAGRGLRADRPRSRAAGRAGRGHDARHVQHPDPGAGARARQVERAELAGELFDLARLRRRARATVGALAVPQHPAGAALCGAGRGARHQRVLFVGVSLLRRAGFRRSRCG